MKKLFLLILAVIMICIVFPLRVQAAEIDQFDESKEEIKSAVDDDTKEHMSMLGVTDMDVTSVSDITLFDSFDLIADLIGDSAAAPISAGVILIAVILLASLLESYTFSLRYIDTKDVMNTVSSLMIVMTLVTPIVKLIESSLMTVKGAASLMLVYVPVMVGIMAFSGHVIGSGAYYATVMTASQAISQLSAAFFSPLLNIFLVLSVTSAVSSRIKLNGICELIAKLIKWTLMFAMALFSAILSIQGVAANAADTVASKAVRFTLSSFIPIVGSSISEAYKSIEGSVGLLRSGIGVFVIIAVLVAFLPIVIQILLWQVSVLCAKTVAQLFDITSIVTILTSISTVLSVMMAMIISIGSVFLISSGVVISVGGAS